MGFTDVLGRVGSALIAAVADRGLEISPEKIVEFTTEQLEWLSKKGNTKSRDIAVKELRKRK